MVELEDFGRAEQGQGVDIEGLRLTARRIRRHILTLVHHAGTGHLGGPLSAVEILTELYFHELRIDPRDPGNPERDRFILSKGHSSPALYAVLAERGYFPVEELLTFDAEGSRLQGHPDMKLTPGVDMSTGSLGQGLSAGVGFAMSAQLRAGDYRTYVLLGDGECQEGQVWEAAMVAARYGLSNLCAIVDWNGLQQYGWATADPAKRRTPVDDLGAKWVAFGWWVIELDGHDFPSVQRALREARARSDRPTVLLARTTKGKGVSFMEGDYKWHAHPLHDEDFASALSEVNGPSFRRDE